MRDPVCARPGLCPGLCAARSVRVREWGAGPRLAAVAARACVGLGRWGVRVRVRVGVGGLGWGGLEGEGGAWSGGSWCSLKPAGPVYKFLTTRC